MNTDEIKAARDKAEADMLAILRDLQSNTGLTVDSVDIRAATIIPLLSSREEKIIVDLKINLKL